ncbi:Lrp/AsnC family transcriptional regulator [Streptomyces malaysiensis]|uniref:Lrp/AsnC family transcriptional regulator n=1 Tax=Streptomyces malaysiensis TaxID=92644 RepID=UPI0011CDD502|nr:Lrp/AsnC family transcriptional regulator [Streptomyces malaysiensis]MCQ6250850.1 Lrp/AsnC family transcriptional regulator [Streptomyces malaysiensis]
MSHLDESRQDYDLDELDRRLIHALQINPRARWAALAPIIGVDAVTLARRWERIVEAGIAWVSGHPGPELRGPSAILEIEAHPAATLGLAQEISADSEAFTVDLTAGGREMLVLVATSSMDALTEYLMMRIPKLDGIRATRAHLFTSPFVHGGQWRLRSLSAEEIAAVERSIEVSRSPRGRVDSQLEDQLLRLLGADGRATVAYLARTVGVGQRRVRDAIAAMTAQGRLDTRLDMAKAQSGRPVHAWYFLRVPAALVQRVGSVLTRISEIRLAVSTVGQYNLILAVWLPTLAGVQRLEAVLEEKLPGVSIADRCVVLRTVKKEGHRLNAHGHATGEFSPLLTNMPQPSPSFE